MLELKEYPEAHTPEGSGMTDSASGTQDRTEASGTTDSATRTQDHTKASGTGDVTRDRTDARASPREVHKPHAKKAKKDRNQKRSSAQKEGVEARRIPNAQTDSEGDPLTYWEVWNAPMMTNTLTSSEGDPLTYREAWNAPILTNAPTGSEGDPLSYREAMEKHRESELAACHPRRIRSHNPKQYI